jgi:hypothetical protein
MKGMATKKPGRIRIWRSNPPTRAIVIQRDGAERQVGPAGLLTFEEASALTRFSAASIRAAARGGAMPIIRGRVRLADVAEWADDVRTARARRREPTSPASAVHRYVIPRLR